ncbi:MAG: hypothetical protein ACM33T_09725 [Solirubrobacterales bacterium]
MLNGIKGHEVTSRTLFAPVRARSQDGVPDTDTAGEAADSDRDSAARQALDAIKQAKRDLKAQRKAAAREKIERIKRQIDALRRFAVGNPKAIAREAARLARQLGGAVAEVAAQAKPGAGLPSESQEWVPTAEFRREMHSLFNHLKRVVREQREQHARNGRPDREYDLLERSVSQAGLTMVTLDAAAPTDIVV